MEPSLRWAASTACRQCSSAIRAQLGSRALQRSSNPTAASTYSVRTSQATSAGRSIWTSRIAKPNAVGRSFCTTAASRHDAAAPAQDALEEQSKRPRLRPDDLFHPFDDSPMPDIRRRAAFMRQHAYCPHPDHRLTRAPTIAPHAPDATRTDGNLAPAHVDYACPDCGIPLYCSKEHFYDDYEEHLKICDQLREINEDDHDLRSGRVFPEFKMAEEQLSEAAVNMSNWDTFLYTREFDAVNSDRSMRHVTKMLTYPITIASIIHELSPYNVRPGGRLTAEGLKSFSGKF